MKTYSIQDLENISIGASFLGSGGGGAFSDSQAILDKIASTGTTEFPIYDVSEAEDTEYLCVAGGIGSPDALSGKLDELITAIGIAITQLNTSSNKITGVLSVETGAVNTMLSILISIKLNLKLYDCDGAGRAVPSLTNLTYANDESYPVSPVSLVSAPSSPAAKPEVETILTVPSAGDAETIIRPVISNPVFGQMGGLALWRQTGAELKNSNVVKNTFDLALSVGEIITKNQSDYSALIDQLGNIVDIQLTGLGVLSNFQEITGGGFDTGVTTIAYSYPKWGIFTNIYILNKNENLITYFDNYPIVISAPNLMCYLIKEDDGKFWPLTNGDPLGKYIGKEIGLFILSANDKLYDTDTGMLQSFNKILQTVNYYGPVIPNILNPSEFDDQFKSLMEKFNNGKK